MAVLPQELLDHIVDHLWDDPTSLKACSFASRTFLHSARLHLFHAIRITSNASMNCFIDLINQSGDILEYIRILTLTETSWDTEPFVFEHMADVSAPNFPFEELPINALVSWPFGRKILALDHVTRLILRSTFIPEPDLLPFFFLSFPKLETLDVLSCAHDRIHDSTQEIPATAPPPSSMPSIRHLAISDSTSGWLVDWFLHYDLAWHLESIKFTLCGPRELKNCARLLDAAGSSLRRLEFSGITRNPRLTGKFIIVTVQIVAYIFSVILNTCPDFLSKNQRIQTLVLNDIELDNRSEAGLERALFILKHVHTPSLKFLELGIFVGDLSKLGGSGWMQIMQNLERIEGSKVINVKHVLGIKEEAVISSIEGQLSNRSAVTINVSSPV